MGGGVTEVEGYVGLEEGGAGLEDGGGAGGDGGSVVEPAEFRGAGVLDEKVRWQEKRGKGECVLR